MSLIYGESVKIQPISHIILENWVVQLLWGIAIAFWAKKKNREDQHGYTNCCGNGKVAVSLTTEYLLKIQVLYI